LQTRTGGLSGLIKIRGEEYYEYSLREVDIQ